jgi:RNA polymerase sigma factor (sigma-70 family)
MCKRFAVHLAQGPKKAGGCRKRAFYRQWTVLVYGIILKNPRPRGVFIMRADAVHWTGMGAIGPEAVTRIWDEHGAALVLYARQWCHAPEDVVQEAFLALVRQAAPPHNPVGWLYRTVRNGAINAGRARGRRARREAVVAPRGEPWFQASEADRLDAAAATEALKQLPDDQREAVIAHLWGGLGFEDMSRLSGTSVSSVYRCYQRGLDALRERLGGSCPTRKSEPKRKT